MKTQLFSCKMLALLVAGSSGVAAAEALAQAYPNKPISLLVPYGPGSGNDVVARIVAQKVAEGWTQPMVVENRAGASGSIGLEATAKAPPDGYTIVIASTSQIINQFVSKVRYDMLRDFAGVCLVGSLPFVLAVPSSLPVRSMDELIALAKSRPGKINYSGQVGSTTQFMGEMLKSARGLDIVMIPYKSTPDAQADVLSGRVEIWFTQMATALPQVKAGKVRILGVAGEKRAAVLPEVPTMAEVGLPTLDVHTGFYILAPAGTPKTIVNALNREFVKAIGTKEINDRLAAAGVEPKSSSPDGLDAHLKSEVARWGKIIKESGIRVE